MGAETLMAAGMGMQGVGGIYDAYSRGRSGRRAERESRRRYDEVRSMGTGMMQNTPFGAETALMDFANLPGMEELKASGYDPSDVDFSGMNVGQDAIMQMLRMDPQRQITGAQERLTRFADQDPYDVSQVLSPLLELDRIQANDAATGVRANVSGLGQRGGSATRAVEGMTRTRMAADAGARNAQIASQIFGQNQGNRLQALATLAGLEGEQGRLRLGAASEANRAGQAQADMRFRNADARNRASEFNADLGFRTGAQNQNTRLQQFAQRLQSLMGAGGLQQGRAGLNAQLLSIIAGLQQPGVAGGSGMGGAFGDIGNMLALLPFLRRELKAGG